MRLLLSLLLCGGAAFGQLSFYPVTPCRVADTRGNGFAGAFGPPTPLAMSITSFPIPQSACLIPATAQAYSLNVTVVPAGTLDYLTIWPTGSPMPVVSTLNDTQGEIVANAAIVPAGTNGAVSVFVYQETDVIIDINGYFLSPPAPAVTPPTATPLTIMLGGQVVGSTSVLNFQPTSATPSGILAFCAPDAALNSIDCGFNVNSAYAATLAQIENNPNFCNSSNGTTQYTCKMPDTALLAYRLGQAFLLRVDATCAATCSLQIDGLSSPITIAQADGMTPPNGTLIAGQPRWAFYDGVVFRLI